MGRELLRRILRDLDGIPPLPHVIQKVMTMTQDPDVTVEALNEVIIVDQALTANILKLCNSAYYGLPREIASIKQAVTYLGFSTIRNLVLTSFLSNVYGGAVTAVGLSPGGLWSHSIATAVAAQALSKRAKRIDAHDISFTCGLLHDVGKTVLKKYASDQEPSIRKAVKESGKNYVEAEREILGFDHAALGAKVADTWNFPPVLVQAIGLHHTPSSAKGDSFLTHVTHIANHLAIQAGIGIEDAELVSTPLSKSSLEALLLQPGDFEQLQQTLLEEYEKASPMIEAGATR